MNACIHNVGNRASHTGVSQKQRIHKILSMCKVFSPSPLFLFLFVKKASDIGILTFAFFSPRAMKGKNKSSFGE